MKKFVKMKTRLNCDLFETYRSLTRKDKMEKWGAIYQEDLFEIRFTCGILRAQIAQAGDLNDIVIPVVWEGLLNGLKVNADGQEEINQKCRLTFYRMNCIGKTEYCSEVHLMVEPIGNSEIDEALFDQMGQYILDQIRKRYNKDWVILDSDLNASILKGSL